MFVIMGFFQESKNKITKDKSGLTYIQLRSEKKNNASLTINIIMTL